ncbi:hypothetical protein BXZ70DRAFT_1012784 [Cristinia sonorae]|uniref:Mitochondrial intermembrane space import and assembly protein 40 n=1 Tax=Cristinia sonorae TaxID=1940300 RepID=A0A8K0XKF7_9AGAR|nr:hypothetical protein BXZ70DRAFT_1012784 [Cristinia sonorae]
MLRTIVARTATRRSLHTSASRASTWRPGRVGMVLGASAAVAYLTWKGETIALDSVASSSKRDTLQPQTPRSSERKSSPQPPFEPSSSIHEKNDDVPPESDAFLPETEPVPPSSSEQDPSVDAAEEMQGGGGGGGGAFNPETGEINWDCPCLGGMAHGPCGMQFREAFSCFVFSEQEPKGIDCVSKFKAMQDCFREHPDVYGEDIMDDDDDEESTDKPAGAVDTSELPQPGSSLQEESVAAELVESVRSEASPAAHSASSP